MEDLGACSGEAAPKPGGAVVYSQAPGGWWPDQVPGLERPGQAGHSPAPSGPPSGGGLRLTPLGLWASVCPSPGLEGAWEASQPPGGSSRWSHWAELLPAWVLGQGEGSHRERLAAPSVFQRLRAGLDAGDGLLRCTSCPGQDCPAGCGLFISSAPTGQCPAMTGNSQLPEGPEP